MELEKMLIKLILNKVKRNIIIIIIIYIYIE